MVQWKFLIEEVFAIKEDKQYTSVHCEKMASGINCEYCETFGLLGKILVPVLILKMFPDSCLCLVLTWKGHYCTCLAKGAQYFLHVLIPLPFSTLFKCAVPVSFFRSSWGSDRFFNKNSNGPWFPITLVSVGRSLNSHHIPPQLEIGGRCR